MTKGNKAVFIIGVVCSALPWATPPLALCLGIAFGLLWENPWSELSATASRLLLQAAVVGLGFGLPISEVIAVGKHSFFSTLVGILCTIGSGYLLGKMLRIPKTTGMLVACGTAICGGSAIAAIAPVLKAKNDEAAVALATVFTLNAVALLTFPMLGHYLGLGQHQFGVWAGMAIHDTSSVVGAAASYGQQALDTATTVKLTRALWIVPVALVTGMLANANQGVKVPRFIILFIVAALLHSAIPAWQPLWQGLSTLAHGALVVSLFFVGSGLNRGLLKRVGLPTFAQGTILWVLVSGATLLALKQGVLG